MPGKQEQTDFFSKLKPAEETDEKKPQEEKEAPTLITAKKLPRKIRQREFNPPHGRLGGWASHYYGNDPDDDKK